MQCARYVYLCMMRFSSRDVFNRLLHFVTFSSAEKANIFQAIAKNDKIKMQVYGKIILCVYTVHICLAEALEGRNKNNIIASELCVIKNIQDERKREKTPLHKWSKSFK